MNEKTIHNGDVEIATQSFGNPAAPPVLLIMGAMASMLWWPEAFCRSLAASGRFVIRYDNRDTGLSTVGVPGAPAYAMEDMADDALAVLDAYGIDRAHVVGMSLGGTIAQIVPLRAPGRLRTLTLLSTWPLGVDTSTLPGMSDAYAAHAAEGETVDWTDAGQMIDYVVKDMAMIASTRHPHDPAAARAFVEADARRARDFLAAVSHFSVSRREDYDGRLAGLAAPLLVLHGESDPLIPPAHARAFADVLPYARIVIVSGGGHELHPADWPQMLDEIVNHTAAG